MKNLIPIILVMILLMSSCKEIQKNQLTESENAVDDNVKTYGLLFDERDSISVALNLDDYKTYEELLDRVQQIGCTDRIPKITLEEDKEIRKIYFIPNCDEKKEAPLIKAKNIILIHEDEVFTYFNNNYSALDSLKSITAMNIKNYGKIESLSESPDKLVFSIAYGLDANPKRLENTLLQLTDVFDEVGGKNNLRIILDKLMIPPPPPPPAPATEVIEVVEDEMEIVEVVEVEEVIVDVYNPVLIKVTGGTFTVGDEDKKPMHKVTLSDYYIGKTEVTVAQYRAYCNATGASMPEKSSWGWNNYDPIVKVSWNDAINYCAWLSKKLDKNISLPTEAQWEFAARGGNQSKGYKYAGSSSMAAAGWYYDHSKSKAHTVATKKANELGLYDMSGNVWEWCRDWYDPNYYAMSPSTNPKGPSSGESRVLRGGSWSYSASGCGVAYRAEDHPSDRDNDFGFRVVVSQ